VFDLSYDQVFQAVSLGIIRGYENGRGLFVKPEDVSEKISMIRSLPKKFWIYKTHAMKEYGLSRNQIETAMALSLVRFKRVKNPHYSTGSGATLVALPDVESNLKIIRSFPKYSAKELTKKHEYNVRRKLRNSLSFYCPRCMKKIRAPRGSRVFEEALYGYKELEDARTILVLLHYRHMHTDYRKEAHNVDRWLKPEEIKILTNGLFKSFDAFIKWYEDNKHDMLSFERETWIETIRAINRTAQERAKKHYSQIALELAVHDDLIKRADLEI
jgi:hypothetical protein